MTAEIPHIVDEAKKLRTRFLLSLIFLIPLMYFTMAHMLVGAPLPSFAKPAVNFALVQLVLTTPILFINYAFFTSGVKAAIKRVPNMDTLVSARFGRFLYLQRRRYVRHRRAHERGRYVIGA